MKDFQKFSSYDFKKNQDFYYLADKASIKEVFIIIALLLFTGFFFVQLRIQFLTKEKNVQELILQKRTLEAEILPLQLEERFLTRYSIISEIAEKELNLKKENIRKRKIIFVNSPQNK